MTAEAVQSLVQSRDVYASFARNIALGHSSTIAYYAAVQVSSNGWYLDSQQRSGSRSTTDALVIILVIALGY